MKDSDLKVRTKRYALAVILLFSELPKRTETQIIGRQFLRSGTSVGDRRTLAISHKKGRRDFLQRASPLAWTKKIARFHFDVLRIIKTCKFRLKNCLNFWGETT